jgi:hypothetical protein
MRNGLLCRRCGAECLDRITESEYVEVECPSCYGVGCGECSKGFFRLTICGRKFVDGEMIRAINLAAAADRHLPQAGGLLDQSAWFVDLWTMLQSEQNKIDADRIERMSRGR